MPWPLPKPSVFKRHKKNFYWTQKLLRMLTPFTAPFIPLSLVYLKEGSRKFPLMTFIKTGV